MIKTFDLKVLSISLNVILKILYFKLYYTMVRKVKVMLYNSDFEIIIGASLMVLKIAFKNL